MIRPTSLSQPLGKQKLEDRDQSHLRDEQRSRSVLHIGLTMKSGKDDWLQKNAVNYSAALRNCGAVPIVLSPDVPVRLPENVEFRPDEAGRLPAQILNHLDGLVLAGGGDVHPRYFGAVMNGADENSISIPRDEMELALCRAALERDIPIFAICRGCQLLNVAMGGGMIQHFPNHRFDTSNPRLHPVQPMEGSRLARLVGSGKIQVNSYHHQGVDDRTLAGELRPAARGVEDRWLLEAFESVRHDWVLGVQWHPERLFELPEEQQRLWDDFIEACGRQRNQEQRSHAHRTL